MDWRKKEINIPHGMVTVKVRSFHEFVSYIDYVHHATGLNKQYVWRGQSCSDWLLNTNIDRKLYKQSENTKIFFSQQKFFLEQEMLKKRTGRNKKIFDLIKYERHSDIINDFLREFKLSVRGRRGANPPTMMTDNDWWALGQHHGLHTPLLDWTGSPFVACFFAFSENQINSNGECAVFGLWENEIELINHGIVELMNPKRFIKDTRFPIIEFFRPFSDENPRLVNQKGLFTRSPLGIDIEEWIRISCDKEYNSHTLIKIILPNKIRTEALRALNRMNINHLSLFPDLLGAAKYCNISLEDNGYKGG